MQHDDPLIRSVGDEDWVEMKAVQLVNAVEDEQSKSRHGDWSSWLSALVAQSHAVFARHLMTVAEDAHADGDGALAEQFLELARDLLDARFTGLAPLTGAVAEVVESGGGVVSGLFNEPLPAFERRRRPRHRRH